MAKAKKGGRVQQFAQNRVLTLTSKNCQNKVFRIISWESKNSILFHFLKDLYQLKDILFLKSYLWCMLISCPKTKQQVNLLYYWDCILLRYIMSPYPIIKIVHQLDWDTIHQIFLFYYWDKIQRTVCKILGQVV